MARFPSESHLTASDGRTVCLVPSVGAGEAGSDPRSQPVTDPLVISIAIVAVVVLVRTHLGVLRQATTTSA